MVRCLPSAACDTGFPSGVGLTFGASPRIIRRFRVLHDAMARAVGSPCPFRPVLGLNASPVRAAVCLWRLDSPPACAPATHRLFPVAGQVVTMPLRVVCGQAFAGRLFGLPTRHLIYERAGGCGLPSWRAPADPGQRCGREPGQPAARLQASPLPGSRAVASSDRGMPSGVQRKRSSRFRSSSGLE